LSQHKLNVCVQIRLISSVSHEVGHGCPNSDKKSLPTLAVEEKSAGVALESFTEFCFFFFCLYLSSPHW